MEILTRENAIHKDKPDGTRVDYYLQPEYEIHYNEVPPGTTQEWHSHSEVEELVFMISGSLEIHWIDEKNEHTEAIKKGDLVRVENSVHTITNTSDEVASFIVFKTILHGHDYSKIFKEDKNLPDRLK